MLKLYIYNIIIFLTNIYNNYLPTYLPTYPDGGLETLEIRNDSQNKLNCISYHRVSGAKCVSNGIRIRLEMLLALLLYYSVQEDIARLLLT
jgi:hypothetical protein